MKFILALLVYKITSFVLRAFHKSEDFAGKLALFIYPNILSNVELPKCVVAIVGSNSKTSIANMINNVLIKSNYKVGYDDNSSNSLESVVSLILRNTTIDRKCLIDVILFEIESINVQDIFSKLSPNYFVVNSIYRNSSTKSGSTDYLLRELKKAMDSKSTVLLNVDDPLALVLDSKDLNSYYYGINDIKYAKKDNNYIGNDAYYCPRCKTKLVYSYHQFGHIGKYNCPKCKLTRQKPNYSISKIDLEKNLITINNLNKINLTDNSIIYAYDMLAAYSLCNLIGVDQKNITKILNCEIEKKSPINFKLGIDRGVLLLSEYENQISYNQNIEFIVSQKEDCSVLLFIDDKNIGANTSWLWDISFELLADKHINEIVASGLYASDIIERLSFSGINMNKVYKINNIKEAIKHIKQNETNYVFAITNNKDKDKFIKEVDAQW